MGVVKKKDNNYWLDYRVNGRRKREKIGPGKALADTVWAKRRVEIAEGKFLDKREVKRVKFKDFSEEFITLHCKPKHKAAVSIVEKLTVYFKDKYLDEVSIVDIEKFKIDKSKNVKPSTVNRYLAIIKCMFNRARDWGRYHGDNPMRKIRMLKEEDPEVQYFEKEDIAKILPHCKGNVGKIVILAINTGMRRGEIFNLKWREIDFNQKLIYLLKTKGGKKRMIPMNETVINTLIGIRKNPRSPYVFCKKDGSKYRDVRTAFSTILKKAGVERIRFHDLRHTFASQLMMSGAELNTVRELLGHSDIKTTLIYSHLSQNHKQRAVDALDRRLDTAWANTPKRLEIPKDESLINI